MAYQGEYFIDRYGAEGRQAHAAGRPDAAAWACRSAPAPTPRGSPATTRGCALYWLVTGKTVGGLPLYRRDEPARPHGGAAALHAWAAPGSPARTGGRGTSRPASWPTWPCCRRTTSPCPRNEIKGIESVLTVVGGKVVHAPAEFAPLAPPPLPVCPDWSPVGVYGGYQRGASATTVRALTPEADLVGTPCSIACSEPAGAASSRSGGPVADAGPIDPRTPFHWRDHEAAGTVGQRARGW